MVNFENLSFDFDSLEPEMDARTVKIHYSEHHRGYVEKLNKTIGGYDNLKNRSAEWLLSNLDLIPKEIRQKVIDFGGGVYNHDFFWSILGKNEIVGGAILEAIDKEFGNYSNFVSKFSEKAMNLFGSGWVWLVLKNGNLLIVSTENQDCVLGKEMAPLIVIDLWEHAYYLKYQSSRSDYVKNFFNILNWNKVNELYVASKG